MTNSFGIRGIGDLLDSLEVLGFRPDPAGAVRCRGFGRRQVSRRARLGARANQVARTRWRSHRCLHTRSRRRRGRDRLFSSDRLEQLHHYAVACLHSGCHRVAILRYHLYEIDHIVNRTLVYGALTATLIAGYTLSLLLVQSILLVRDGSTIAVAVSTLAMVALVGHLRRRIEAGVDRRFSRSRYDAAKIEEAFGTRLRQQTNLNAITDDLGRVVRGTLRPSQASVWLSGPRTER